MQAKWPPFKLLGGLDISLSLYNYCCMMSEEGYFPEMVESYLKDCDEVLTYTRRVKDSEIEKAVREAYRDALTPNRKEIGHE